MGTKPINRREKNIKREQKRKKKRVVLSLIIPGLALVVVALGWNWWSGQADASNVFDYRPEDIATVAPIAGIHEMEPGPPIPLLPKDQPQPKIMVNESSFNFGSIGSNEIVTQEFVLANVGEAPLTISRVYTTCGCTTADLTGSVIEPGQVSVVTLTLDAGYHDVRGQTVRRGVIIENNDPKNSNVEIWTQATVRTTP
jgi:hypothetical protein